MTSDSIYSSINQFLSLSYQLVSSRGQILIKNGGPFNFKLEGDDLRRVRISVIGVRSQPTVRRGSSSDTEGGDIYRPGGDIGTFDGYL